MTKRIPLIFVTLVLIGGGIVSAQVPYDSAVTVQIMRNNARNFGQLNTAVEQADFAAASEALVEIGQGSLRLLRHEPPRGRKAVWDRIHRTMVETAVEGIQASNNENVQALADVASRVGALVGEGHGTFQ